jgi:hypothetical protein
MELFMNILASILAALGYFLTWIFNKKKLRGYKLLLLFLGAILTVTLIWWQRYSQNKEAASLRNDITNITNQNILLISSSDSLKTELRVMQQDIAQMRKENQRLASQLEPFMNAARRSHPGINDTLALQKLASDLSKEISKIKPKLVFLGQTELQRDPVSGLFQRSYGFGSEPTHGLSDVQIRIKFDGKFRKITPTIGGAWVEEQGTRVTIDPDSTGFYYITGYLKEGNYVNIEVISKDSLGIISMKLLSR